MEEADELGDYLPLSFKSQSEQDYIAFLWDAFETNYTNSKYQFAFLAYHMLTMSFVHFNIWQIKQARPGDFEKGLIGFVRDEKALLEATSPFVFSAVNEPMILRFLKLIACDNPKIGTYAKLVDDRNDTAHPNGNIFFSTQAATVPEPQSQPRDRACLTVSFACGNRLDRQHGTDCRAALSSSTRRVSRPGKR